MQVVRKWWWIRTYRLNRERRWRVEHGFIRKNEIFQALVLESFILLIEWIQEVYICFSIQQEVVYKNKNHGIYKIFIDSLVYLQNQFCSIFGFDQFLFSNKFKFCLTSSLSASTFFAARKYDWALSRCPLLMAKTAKLFSAAPCDPSELMHKRRHLFAKLKSPLV